MILSCGMVPGKEEMAFFPDLIILHCTDLSLAEDISLVDSLRQSGLFTIQLVMGPVRICKQALLPSQSVPFSLPKQSFERFGPVELTLEADISHDKALIVVENDKDFCRVDSLQSHQELLEILNGYQSGKEPRLLGHFQLADTLMRQVGFKLGKINKFGA